MDKVTTAVIDAIVPVIRNIGAVAECATRGHVVNALAWMLVIRALIPTNYGPVHLYNKYQEQRLKTLIRAEEARAAEFDRL
jgi:hypothetical protein